MRKLLSIIAALGLIIVFLIHAAFPGMAAQALLKPYRTVSAETPHNATEVSVINEEVRLNGWHYKTGQPFRGTVIYLHGVSDNKGSSSGVAAHFLPLGLDVISYDSRVHGASGGDYCTYGYHEKEDLKRIIAEVREGPLFLIGSSMGAATALQAAPDQPRVKGIVTIDVFSDLRSVARERMPSIIPDYLLRLAFKRGEKLAEFKADEVSPLLSASRLSAPTLVIHGADDIATLPENSTRVYHALQGKKKLLLVEGAGHCEATAKPETWIAIKEWVQQALKENS